MTCQRWRRKLCGSLLPAVHLFHVPHAQCLRVGQKVHVLPLCTAWHQYEERKVASKESSTCGPQKPMFDTAHSTLAIDTKASSSPLTWQHTGVECMITRQRYWSIKRSTPVKHPDRSPSHPHCPSAAWQGWWDESATAKLRKLTKVGKGTKYCYPSHII